MNYYPAKCILSGEHTVLCGGTAIVAPLRAYQATISYQSSPKLAVFLNGRPFSQGIFIFLRETEFLPNTFSGEIQINSNIPPSSGLGSSAALCVAIADLLAQKGYILAERVFEVARLCENLFHGISSGLDIAGVLANSVLLYTIDNKPAPFLPTWEPLLYVSDSGVPSDTKTTVDKVQSYRRNSVDNSTDLKMAVATQQIHQALLSEDHNGRLAQLCDGIALADECFKAWDIVGNCLQNHQAKLKQAGALATKPTGSGNGGHVLSVWQETPPASLNLLRLNLC